jgi:hypothetical protein
MVIQRHPSLWGWRILFTAVILDRSMFPFSLGGFSRSPMLTLAWLRFSRRLWRSAPGPSVFCAHVKMLYPSESPGQLLPLFIPRKVSRFLVLIKFGVGLRFDAHRETRFSSRTASHGGRLCYESPLMGIGAGWGQTDLAPLPPLKGNSEYAHGETGLSITAI